MCDRLVSEGKGLLEQWGRWSGRIGDPAVWQELLYTEAHNQLIHTGARGRGVSWLLEGMTGWGLKDKSDDGEEMECPRHREVLEHRTGVKQWGRNVEEQRCLMNRKPWRINMVMYLFYPNLPVSQCLNLEKYLGSFRSLGFFLKRRYLLFPPIPSGRD